MNLIDLKGQKFGRLTVIQRSLKVNQRFAVWDCICWCGNEKQAVGAYLRTGRTTSCGCLQKDRASKSNTKHFMTGTRTYHIWANMLQRCNNKNSPAYKWYGGRGIFIINTWLNFESFYEDMGACPDNLSIERKNNQLGYFKENCYWATPRQQASNTRKTVLISHEGESLCMSEWARRFGLNQSTISRRLKRGLSFIEAIK